MRSMWRGLVALAGLALAACPSTDLLVNGAADGGLGNGKLPDGGRAGCTDPKKCDAGGGSGGLAFARVWSGYAHMCATVDVPQAAGEARTGPLACWGTNTSGQVGAGDTQDHPKPVVLQDLGSKVIYASLGMEHSCAIESSQQGSRALWCWGKNNDGRLGLEDTQPRVLPARTSLNDMLTVQAGEAHTCALSSRHTLFCWGSNERGQVGTGAPTGEGQFASKPQFIQSISPTDLADGYARHACAVAPLDDEPGHVFCWGSNQFAQLGDGTTEDRNVPTVVPGIVGAVKVYIGMGNSCAQFADGSLTCWGQNRKNQLADGTLDNRTYPGPGPNGLSAPSLVSWGFDHGCALDAQGVLCWGENGRGQAGVDAEVFPDGGAPNVLQATRVSFPASKDPEPFLSGRWHSVCAGGAGGIYCWGANGAGQLLTGDLTDRRTPVLITP